MSIPNSNLFVNHEIIHCVVNTTERYKMSIKEKRIDPRVRRTRQLLRNALWELIPEKGYEAITIQEIADRATLNRTTFYLNYRDKADLLYQGIEDVIEGLLLRDHLSVVSEDIISLEKTRFAFEKDFEHFAENFEFYSAMLGEHGVWGFFFQLQDYIYKATKRRFESIQDKKISGSVSAEFVLNYIATAYMGTIRWWIKNQMPHTPSEMASQLIWIYSQGVFKALGLEVGTSNELHSD